MVKIFMSRFADLVEKQANEFIKNKTVKDFKIALNNDVLVVMVVYEK